MGVSYTSELNVKILIDLMKKNGIKKVIVSPGMTNISFVASIQQDPFFELYSAVDERSAAYMACGMAAETDEVVAISCTGATSSRNYAPGLTEAFYRKLPILAITSSQPSDRVGHLLPQVTNRTSPMPDMVKLSVELPKIKDSEDEWNCIVNANKAIQELRRNGGGPVHINLICVYGYQLDSKELPNTRKIERITYRESFPTLSPGRIAIYVGTHQKWNSGFQNLVDEFCEYYDAVVLCDSTSGYKGKYGVNAFLVANQNQARYECCSPRLLIHIGEISGSYINVSPNEVWRVSLDGEIRDTFRKITKVFDMAEIDFIKHYVDIAGEKRNTTYFGEWNQKYNQLLGKVEDLPFSQAWIAWKTHSLLPGNSRLHLGILNSLRCWNYFKLPDTVYGYSNVGGFGIDGCVSTLVGAAIGNPQNIFFGTVGDLAFFYDLNVLGNRSVPSNVRLMVVNNSLGYEFRHYGSVAVGLGLESEIDDYISAKGHNMNANGTTVKNIAEAFGFYYISATDKESYIEMSKEFLTSNTTDKPMIFEVRTDVNSENEAQFALNNIEISATSGMKNLAKNVLGKENFDSIKKLLKR